MWLRFRGGNGVATGLGGFAPLAPVAALAAVAVFAAVAWASRYVSLGSVAGALTLATLAWLLGATLPVAGSAAFTAGLVLFRHRSTLWRILGGTERRAGQHQDTTP